MSQDTVTQQAVQPSRRVLLGAALLSVFFTFFTTGSIFNLVTLTSVNVRMLLGFLLPPVVFGAGLRWLARRYRTSTVQAGALVGAGIMTVTSIYMALFTFGRVSLTILAFLPLIAVKLITQNPSPEPGELTGVGLIFQSLPVGDQGTDNGEQSSSEHTSESTSRSNNPTTRRLPNFRDRLPVSRYWLVVGSGFAASIPIALVNTELGLGLLSSFLTAYALSHRIEQKSGNPHDKN